jgi:glycosyltransferase involved in cell wall biosynthesis
MKIVLAHDAPIPVEKYGGTERVIWDLGHALTLLGHDVTFLVPEGSSCHFAKIQHINPKLSWNAQIPKDADVVHFQFNPETEIDFPFLMTEHGHADKVINLPKNTVFLSRKHAQCHGSTQFVYNGLDWGNYGAVDFNNSRNNYHFLGKAARRIKNIKGAIRVAHLAKAQLDVLGGDRFNIKGGFRWTLAPQVHFHGMVGGEKKRQILQHSRGLIFPVRWHEPFGLALIESLYFGCPVFATPYGAIPEIVSPDCGFLADDAQLLAQAIRNNQFDMRCCHEQAKKFNSTAMAKNYLELYDRVIAKETLHHIPPKTEELRTHLPWK